MSESDKSLIYVVDDDAAISWALSTALEQAQHQVRSYPDAERAWRAIRRERPDCVFCDVQMPGQSGIELLAELHKEYPQLPVIIMTAHGSMEIAVDAVKAGAFDYLIKPLDLEQVLKVAERAIGDAHVAIRIQAEAISEDDEKVSAQQKLVGSSKAMQEVFRCIALAAPTRSSVMIQGPSGSGKELVARSLHAHSEKPKAPFIALNCAALPEHLVESELFGHVAGAFTDARQDRVGVIEAANGGTLFLDEIGELPAGAQAKLLRFLEERTINRVGSHDQREVDVRIIAATHRNLEERIEENIFREDLYHRLRVLHISLPPLADRPDDIPELISALLTRIATSLQRDFSVSREAYECLLAYHYPGNARELRHVLEEAAVLAAGGLIDKEHLRLGAQENGVPGEGNSGLLAEFDQLVDTGNKSPYTELLDQYGMRLIEHALMKTQGNQLRAAEMLGINRMTLKKKLDQQR